MQGNLYAGWRSFEDHQWKVEVDTWAIADCCLSSVEGELLVLFDLEVRLSHAEVENGAIGYHSDMWAGTSSTHKGNSPLSERTRKSLYLGHALSTL